VTSATFQKQALEIATQRAQTSWSTACGSSSNGAAAAVAWTLPLATLAGVRHKLLERVAGLNHTTANMGRSQVWATDLLVQALLVSAARQAERAEQAAQAAQTAPALYTTLPVRVASRGGISTAPPSLFESTERALLPLGVGAPTPRGGAGAAGAAGAATLSTTRRSQMQWGGRRTLHGTSMS